MDSSLNTLAPPALERHPLDVQKTEDLAQNREALTPLPLDKGKIRRFMAIVRGKKDLGSLLEAIYITHLLKENHTHLLTSLLVHAENYSLAEATGLFNHIHRSGAKLKKIVQAEKVDLLYAPSHDNYAQFLTTFSGSHIGITGFGRNILGPHLGLPSFAERKQQDLLRKRGYDLKPKKTLPKILSKIKLESSPVWLSQANHCVWFSLFDENELNRFWPPAYALRLLRLLERAGFSVLLPVPELEAIKNKSVVKKMQSDLAFLKKNAPASVQFIKDPSPAERAAGMQRALAVVGPAGPDMLLCSLLRRPSLTLHDMRSHALRLKGNESTSQEKNLRRRPIKIPFGKTYCLIPIEQGETDSNPIENC